MEMGRVFPTESKALMYTGPAMKMCVACLRNGLETSGAGAELARR